MADKNFNSLNFKRMPYNYILTISLAALLGFWIYRQYWNSTGEAAGTVSGALDLVILGSLVTTGLYHTGLYFIQGRYRPTLYFGIICLLIGSGEAVFNGSINFNTLFGLNNKGNLLYALIDTGFISLIIAISFIISVRHPKAYLMLKRSAKLAAGNASDLETEWHRRILDETLNDLTKALTSTLDLSEVLKRLMEELENFMHFDSYLVILKDKDSFRVVLNTEYGHQYKPIGTVIDVEKNRLLFEIIRGRKPIAVSGENSPDYKDCNIGKSAGSLMGVPIIYNNEVKGILIIKDRNPEIYNDYEKEIAFSFAGRAGIAIENARLFEEVRNLAVTDGLTGMYNRRYFFELAEREFERDKRYKHQLSLIMLDVDCYKKLNDTYGHFAGDEVLKGIAGRLLKVIRATDIAGRYGGDEFAILLPETGLASAFEVAERLRTCIANEPIKTENHGSISTTISLGVSTLAGGISDLYSLFTAADAALYEAKRKGRNCTVAKDKGAAPKVKKGRP